MNTSALRRRQRWQRAILGLELLAICAILALWHGLSVRPLTLFDMSFWAVATAPLALSAMTQTLPIMAGGQGLAAGATAYLVSIVVANLPVSGMGSATVAVMTGLLLGGAIGAFNGLLIGYMRISSTAVTISTGIITGSIAQILASSTPPAPPAEPLNQIIFGHAMEGWPLPLLAIIACLAVAGEYFRRSSWGHGLRLVGMRPQLAERLGVKAAPLRASAYAIAGLGSAATGIVLTAQLGASDLFLGSPLLLQIYSAVALGGSVPGLRAGSILGSLLGALVITGTTNLLLPLGIDDYFSPAFDGLWLMIGIGICGLAVRSFLPEFSAVSALRAPPRPGNGTIHQLLDAGLLQMAIGLLIAIGIAMYAPKSGFPTVSLSLAVLALGQAAVMRAGGLDLSMPSVIAFASVATVSLTQGSAAAFPGAAAAILLLAAIVGLAHGWIAIHLGRITIVCTLATAGLVHVAMAWLAVTRPPGFVAPELVEFVNGSTIWIALAWVVPLSLAIWLDRRNMMRRAPDRVIPYLLSAFCSATFGIFAALQAGQASPGLMDTWLAPTFVAALIGGMSFRGGSGSLLGAVGGAILVLSFDTSLVAIGASSEQRMLLVGAIVLSISCFIHRTVPKGPHA